MGKAPRLTPGPHRALHRLYHHHVSISVPEVVTDRLAGQSTNLKLKQRAVHIANIYIYDSSETC